MTTDAFATAPALKFTASESVDGRYRHDGERLTYTATKTTGQWMLEVHTQDTTIAGLVLKGEQVAVTFTDTLRLARAIASHHEALGEGYESNRYGYKSRFTTAIGRAYDDETERVDHYDRKARGV